VALGAHSIDQIVPLNFLGAARRGPQAHVSEHIDDAAAGEFVIAGQSGEIHARSQPVWFVAKMIFPEP